MLAAGEFQRAHELAMGVPQENPRVAEAYFIMALIARRHDNVAKAEQVVGRALMFDGDNPDYLLFRAQCLLELSRHEEARALVAQLEDAALSTAHQSDTLGVLQSRLGWHSRALERFQRACALQPGNVDYQYNLASCLQFSGLFDEAATHYEKAIALGDAPEWAYYMAARTQARIGADQTALRYLNVAIDKGWTDTNGIKNAEDFDSLHDSPEWEAILGRLEEQKTKDKA